MRFRDRKEAGEQLAARLAAYRDMPDVLVLALPRGGVPVGLEIANALHAPLDLLLVRKLGVPGQEEYAMGAIALGDVVVWNKEALAMIPLPQSVKEKVVARERQELERRNALYRDGRPMPDVAGKTAIIVDDGLATGSTMRAAIQALRAQAPEKIVVAVPVGPPSVYEDVGEADEVICPYTPSGFMSVGGAYMKFPQLTDAEVNQLLSLKRKRSA